MTGAATGRPCRSCAGTDVDTVLDLGDQPVADDLFENADAARTAPRHRLALAVCGGCGLVQLDPATPELPNATHGHGSAFSGTVLGHERSWAAELLDLRGVAAGSRVLDVGSGSGGLLRPFADAGWEVRGWERDAGLAARATAAGLPTVHPTDGAAGRAGFDLVIANHTLSHADNLDAALAVLAGSLAPDGTLAVEFHSALGILAGGQFDVICHAHRSYLSLTALATGLARHGLTVTTARMLPLHGGVVRLQARPEHPRRRPDASVADVLAAEQAAGIGSADAWTAVAGQAARTREAVVSAVEEQVAAGRRVVAYGAPSRGVTLLNYCMLDAGQIPMTADRSPVKQGRFLPGVATAVCTPDELAAARPDVVVVLVWPLRDEVLAQLDGLRRTGTRFLFPLPEPELVG